MIEIKSLKDIRRRLGLTQKQFANKAGVSQSLIAKVESGRLDPSYSNVKKIEQALQMFSKEKELAVKDIMVTKIFSCDKESSARYVIQKMRKEGVSQLPVIDKEEVVGMVTEGSILSKEPEEVARSEASDLMVEPPPVIAEDAKISVVSYLLKHYPIVLVKKQGRLVGLVSKSDLLKILV